MSISEVLYRYCRELKITADFRPDLNHAGTLYTNEKQQKNTFTKDQTVHICHQVCDMKTTKQWPIQKVKEKKMVQEDTSHVAV